MGAEKGPLRCATTNTSVVFKKADYEQDIDIKHDEEECKVHVPTMNEFVFACITDVMTTSFNYARINKLQS